ncbi:AAA domain-containing protein [Hydrogenophaga sp. IBVHS2]|uniref:AAA domain-containing protein n=1 Tax=Hydrogenophaga sp. IBVHS2 TaxID=1985170 RepID=UPI000A322B36|nr:AAA domain-containing protein [Hydrogenophaga sp. IBVHS2]
MTPTDAAFTPAEPDAVVRELRHVQALMQLEQQEDQAQFRLKSAKAGIAERKRRGVTWHPVTITQEDIGFGGKVVLELERPAGEEGLHLFQVGRNAALFGPAQGPAGDPPTLSGVITRLRRNRLQLTTHREDLPDWVLAGGRLGIDLTFDEVSYREMNQALNEVLRARDNRLAELRDVLLGARQARFDATRADDLVYPSPLNDSQLEAVRHVVSARDVAIIHGPPGTGKTTTLVQAIRETIRRERRVLVCAPSNTAVDLLTEKLAAHGVNVIRMGNPSRVSDLLLAHTLDARVMAHGSYGRMRALRQTADQYRQTAQQHVRHYGHEERQERQRLRDEARQLFLQADDLERFITQDVLDSVQVITCTLVGASQRGIRDLVFDTVFIDEAAQAIEPGCWIPIARGQRVVLAGDHHQLPPTVKSEQAAREGLRETLFEKCIRRQPATARMLTLQYRMHEQIMAFSSQRFYGGRLQAHPRVRHAGLAAYDPVFAPDLPVEFLDTAGFGFVERTVPESRSTANPEEAALLLRRLNQLLAAYDPAGHAEHPLTLGVIAPYRAQINCLQDAIEQEPLLGGLMRQRQLSVGTVDAFQGQERDIIAISLTRSNRLGEIGFLSDIRRMNVGMTRARRKLLLVGDSSTLGAHPFFRELLAHVQHIGGHRTAWAMEE